MSDPEHERAKLERELMEVAHRCSTEIRGLRATIDRLAPKAEAYDSLTALIRMFPRPLTSEGEDLAWRLDRRVAELKKAMEPTDAQQG
jgi:signal transduction histidine kinase